jgi:hypothetical protein
MILSKVELPISVWLPAQVGIDDMLMNTALFCLCASCICSAFGAIIHCDQQFTESYFGCQSGTVVRSIFEINISACHLCGHGFDSRSSTLLM